MQSDKELKKLQKSRLLGFYLLNVSLLEYLKFSEMVHVKTNDCNEVE